VGEVVSHGLGLARPGWRANLEVVGTVVVARLKIVARYKGVILMEAFLPIVFAALPILLGVSIAGGSEKAATNFFNATGTENYALYMLIGASTFMVVSLMLWLVGYWLRREQESGTLEALYLVPTRRIYILAGVTTYAMIRSLTAFLIAIILGSLIFGVNPFSGNVLMAIAFLGIGLLPMWGISFLFGAFIMKVKEANSVIQLMQWVVAFLMGVYFPVTVFPPLLRFFALIFPPTVMTDGMRGSILALETLYGGGYVNFAILIAMAFVIPYLGYETFLRMERRIKRNEGVGQF